VARSGVHGANRLASNSLLEGLVFAERVARDLIDVPDLRDVPKVGSWKVSVLRDRGAAQVAADNVRAIMWDDAGIVRSADGLWSAFDRLMEIESRLPEGATEETNLVQTAEMIVWSALQREESRGGHYRSDFPRPKKGKMHVEI
jgi:L-aspartate oxidase